ncbi:ectoine/hydroxyectoine ABC transporter substrate-binding protein EhuB [Sphaerisporangium rufum]|uniref:Ectoine/hydroxyectoine ABC transporter substrate-binding protein EhuB n=1 Tax=Sphaerisporangium rufum TaxID=1381558 RepID=A0A919V2P0_9ACTN|nr:ectoine/hydroxyectoine ABC transporter substrate-binding protein EhuB [Sphaerisporangium rufum]GII79183.1 ectoine/hydroxyectoine ABC transporter substrate-binding protein EhuB [Sphaerisporangium rufum]
MADTPYTRRGFMRGTGALITALAAAPLAVAGCSKAEGTGGTGATGDGDTLERIKSTGRVKVGFANEAPYGFRDKSGKLTGEAPELARAIFKGLGTIELEPVLVDSFGALIPGLVAGQYDLIAAGMFITPERCGQIAFSNPDYAGASAFMVERGNPKGLTSFDKVKSSGATIAVLEGAAEKGYADAAGVDGGKIKVYPKANDAVQGLADGRVDAVALTAITLRWTLKENPSFAGAGLEVTEGFIPVVNGQKQLGAGGFGFRTSDTTLRQAFDTELKKLQDGGKLLPIVEPFGFGETEVETAKTLTAEQLCAA